MSVCDKETLTYQKALRLCHDVPERVKVTERIARVPDPREEHRELFHGSILSNRRNVLPSREMTSFHICAGRIHTSPLPYSAR